MNYYELSFTYTSPIEKEIINDVLAAELGEIGFESFTESEKGLLGYKASDIYPRLYTTKRHWMINWPTFR